VGFGFRETVLQLMLLVLDWRYLMDDSLMMSLLPIPSTVRCVAALPGSYHPGFGCCSVHCLPFSELDLLAIDGCSICPLQLDSELLVALILPETVPIAYEVLARCYLPSVPCDLLSRFEL
jgi:hypothetical protein